MTSGLLISSNTKSKLHLRKLKNPNEQNILDYKTFIKIYNKIIRVAKTTYYEKLLADNSKDIKKTWKIINDIIQKKINPRHIHNQWKRN